MVDADLAAGGCLGEEDVELVIEISARDKIVEAPVIPVDDNAIANRRAEVNHRRHVDKRLSIGEPIAIYVVADALGNLLTDPCKQHGYFLGLRTMTRFSLTRRITRFRYGRTITR